MIKEQKDNTLFVSIILLVILHLVGVAGILSSHQNSFSQLSLANLLATAILLFINHKQFNKAFFIFCSITFLAGFLIELIGVKTGLIFGRYCYGNTLGLKIANVPLVIGLNWLILVYSVGNICDKVNTSSFFKSILGALMLVVLDFFMEPFAIKHDFWSWYNSDVPVQNYIAWFIASFFLLLLFYKLPFEKNNKIAPILYVIQLLFFILIDIFNDISMHYIYLSLILFTISYPLFKSFENKIQFYKKWKYLFPAIISSAIIFSAWDVWFTHIGIWQFNPQYVLGFYILNLPIEEWLFFIVVPFSCVFIYEVMNYFVKKDILAKHEKYITNILAVSLLLVAMVYHDRLHTFITYLSLSTFLFIHHYILKSTYLGRYYIAWTVCILPFAIVNGILTSMPIITYSESEILGIRIYTIPLEDVFYGMLNFLVVITIYEWLKQADYAKASEDKQKK